MEPASETLARKHPELTAAFEKLRAETLEAIAATAPTDRDEREALYFKLRGIEAAREAMLEALTNKALDQIAKDYAATLDQ